MHYKNLTYFILVILLVAGCSKEYPNQPLANKTPKTFLWLFPDSTIREGNSRQRIRWWGEDADGVIKGYLFASGKLTAPGVPLPPDAPVQWRWRTKNDTLLAFPLLVKQDTFQVAVRAVDNSFSLNLPEQAVVRLSPSPYYDANENNLMEPGEELPTIMSAMDIAGASLDMPLLNQPPSIVFAQNPNDPTVSMQQPETTFTAATFSWVGSDPDGDATIASYEIALNDTSDPSGWLSVPGNVRLLSLVVPRLRSDTAGSVVNADTYGGTFSTTRQFRGTLQNLKLDAQNTFFVRARDVAGDVSPTVQLPGAGRSWYVKKPNGKLLIIADYIASDSAAALSFYKNTLPGVSSSFAEFEVLNIGRGLTAQQKRENKVGIMVPPFIDPAFLYTLHLFDAVLWYSEQYPSLGVAQYPLFQYVRDASHRGKVIFTTMFENSIDPRGALKDFAPIDSISSVELSTGRLLPTSGDTRIPSGFYVHADSSEPSNIYPQLRFGPPPPPFNFLVFMRSIYKRADARYIYTIQEDTRLPVRYVYTPTLSEMKSLASIDASAWSCGTNGEILTTSDNGAAWRRRNSGTTNNLNGIQFLDASNGWIVGDGGVILNTNDGGVTWANRSVLALENSLAVWFSAASHGIVVGSNGFLIRTTNGGTTWNSPSSRTNKSIRAVHFADANNGIAVGDSGLIIKTTNGGAEWSLVPPITGARLNAVKYNSSSTAFAVGTSGSWFKTTDGGSSWVTQPSLGGNELKSLYFADGVNGWICGANGVVYRTGDGGTSWIIQSTGIGQHLNAVSFSSLNGGYATGTSGIIIGSDDAGISWTAQPKGNLNVGVVDGIGPDGKPAFVFLGLPLHVLNGDGNNVSEFLKHILLQEFGL